MTLSEFNKLDLKEQAEIVWEMAFWNITRVMEKIILYYTTYMTFL